MTIACCPLVLLTATERGWASSFLCFAFSAAVLLHSARCQSQLSTWSLIVLGCVSAVAFCLASAGLNWWFWVFAAIISLGFAATPLWVEKLSNLQPTTMVWIERLESLAIAAVIPLACQLLGVFGMLRGLDVSFGG